MTNHRQKRQSPLVLASFYIRKSIINLGVRQTLIAPARQSQDRHTAKASWIVREIIHALLQALPGTLDAWHPIFGRPAAAELARQRQAQHHLKMPREKVDPMPPILIGNRQVDRTGNVIL